MAPLEFLGEADLVKQGAEARLYRAQFLGKPTIVKERFPKRYRLPVLDEKLSHRRTVQEVRSILRCRRAGKCQYQTPEHRMAKSFLPLCCWIITLGISLRNDRESH